MGFVIGANYSFSRRPPLQYGPSCCSSSSSRSGSLLLCAHWKVARKKRMTLVMARLDNESPENDSFTKRRAFLLVGIAALPALQQLAAIASERGRGIRSRIPSRSERYTPSEQAPSRLAEQTSTFEEQNSTQELQNTQIEDNDNHDSMAAIQNPQIADNKDQDSVVAIKNPQMVDNSEQQEAPENLFFSLLNEVGIIGSGILGALYALSQKDKAVAESAVESMKSMLDAKEAAMTTLHQNFDARMLMEQEERRKQIRKLKEEEAALSNRLASANATITALGQDLQSKKWGFEDLKVQFDQLECRLSEAAEERKVLEGKIKEKMDDIGFLHDRVSLLSNEIKDKGNYIEELNSSLCDKELEYNNLMSIIDQTRNDHEHAKSAIERLEAEVLQVTELLDSRNSSIDELNIRVQSLVVEKDDINKEFSKLQDGYRKLKLSSEEKAGLDAKLLLKKNDEVQQLGQKLELALDEAKRNQTLISSLEKEKGSIQAMLKEEINRSSNLQNELQITQHSLDDSKLEVSSMLKRSKELEERCQEFMSQCLTIQEEFSESKKLLNSSLDEAKSASMQLSDELAAAKGQVDGTRQELFTTSEELKSSLEARESLKKELLDIYKKAEIVANDLKEQRGLAATLKEELTAAKEQLLKDSETREVLVRDLDEAKKSLDEMNSRSMSLSRELESVNSRISSLKEEREFMYKSLLEQRDVAKEAHENVEDAQNLIIRLGTERENLLRRAKKLEEELATAKGEILLVRRQSSLNKASFSEHEKDANGVEATNSIVSRKGASRRKKGGTSTEAFQSEG